MNKEGLFDKIVEASKKNETSRTNSYKKLITAITLHLN